MEGQYLGRLETEYLCHICTTRSSVKVVLVSGSEELNSSKAPNQGRVNDDEDRIVDAFGFKVIHSIR
jgi:hypothetical protein